LDELKYQKAKTLHAAQQHEEALSILADILHRNPLFGQCMVLKAQVHLALGDEAAAMAAIEQAKALWQTADPAYVEYQQLLSLEQNLPTDGG
jgi:tetratricopeptide (TPR) repeat protein